jgi:hypothetical protein
LRSPLESNSTRAQGDILNRIQESRLTRVARGFLAPRKSVSLARALFSLAALATSGAANELGGSAFPVAIFEVRFCVRMPQEAFWRAGCYPHPTHACYAHLR